MTGAWRVPDSYRPHAQQWDSWRTWLPGLGRTAAACAADWAVVPDGPPMHGWTSMVWPVRGADGQAYVLKLAPPVPQTEAEAITLSTWAEHGLPPRRMIVPTRIDLDRRAMLLPRLEPEHSLEHHPDVDEAVAVIGEVLASIRGIEAPAGIPSLLVDLAAVAETLDQTDRLPTRTVARAQATIADLEHRLTRPLARLSLLHNDCHFLNVLHTDRPDLPEWIGIDPSPLAGLPEWELTPMLRNRWAAAVATGDPDRALRRRVDHAAEIIGLDRELTRSCAQLVAVFNLATLLPDRSDHMFFAPYSVMSTW